MLRDHVYSPGNCYSLLATYKIYFSLIVNHCIPFCCLVHPYLFFANIALALKLFLSPKLLFFTALDNF